MSDQEAYALGVEHSCPFPKHCITCGGVKADPVPEPEPVGPWVGQAVHYVSHGTPRRADGSQEYSSECRAAVVTAVSDESPEMARLCVFSPEGMFFTGYLEYETAPVGGSWHWTHP